MDSEMRPSDTIVVESMRDAGAVASLKARGDIVSLSMAKILDAVVDAGRQEDLFGGDPPTRSKQVDRLRSIVKRQVKAGLMGEVEEASEGGGRGYYVYAERAESDRVVTVAAFEGLEIEEQTSKKKRRKATTDDERMARPEWGRNLSHKTYHEWLDWREDFYKRKLKGDLAAENGILLPDDFSLDTLCEMWAAGGSGFNERKLVKRLRERFPAGVAAKD